MNCKFDGNLDIYHLQTSMEVLLLLAYSLKPTNNGPKTYQKVSRNGQNCYYNAVYMGSATSMTL